METENPLTFKITDKTVISGGHKAKMNKDDLQRYIAESKYSNLRFSSLPYMKGRLIKGSMKLHTKNGYFKIKFDVFNGVARRITFC